MDLGHIEQDPRRNVRKHLPAIMSKRERRPGKPVQKSRQGRLKARHPSRKRLKRLLG